MIALGCDHGGLALKNAVKQYLEENQIPYRDFGTMTEDSIDYAPLCRLRREFLTGGRPVKGKLQAFYALSCRGSRAIKAFTRAPLQRPLVKAFAPEATGRLLHFWFIR